MAQGHGNIARAHAGSFAIAAVMLLFASGPVIDDQ
jgi:hypothetical protein